MKKLIVKKLKVKRDARGWLAEILRPEDVAHSSFGQVTVTTAKKGETKGKHYHLRKTEWYCVIRGKARLTLRNNADHKKMNIELSEKNLSLVRIPPNWFHAITNTGSDEMYLLVYCDESFAELDPDTYYE